MKKIFSLALCLCLTIPMVLLSGCGEKATLKYGLGVYSYYAKATDAEGDTNGKGEMVATAAGVLLDGDKIVKCVIDTADNTLEYTSSGAVVTPSEFKTKYEYGDDYNMKKYGGAKKEWYEQVDSFVATVEGKTLDEVKALVVEGDKGNDEVVSAGCTIMIADFVKAIEIAVDNSKESTATAEDTLKLGIVSAQKEKKDATADAEGATSVETSIVGTVLKDGKVVVSQTDAVEAKFTFDAKGAATLDTKTALNTKRAAGKNYGMAQYGQDLNGDGKVKEWNEQAAAFDDALKGKTAKEIEALVAENGYAVKDLQTAGCTINIAGMDKAAVKAATK